MKKFLFIVCAICVAVPAYAEKICEKRVHLGTKELCLTQVQPTLPTFTVKMPDEEFPYYAAMSSVDNLGTLRIDMNDTTYSVYDYDDDDYELIHWLSGEDELVEQNGEKWWMDRITDKDGALNFKTVGTITHTADNGYYSADGTDNYFVTDGVPDVNFGTEWYVDIITEPGTGNRLVDFSYNWDATKRTGIFFGESSSDGRLCMDFRPNNTTADLKVITSSKNYTHNGVLFTRFGARKCAETQYCGFIAVNGELFYGESFTGINYFTDFYYPFAILGSPRYGNVYGENNKIYDMKIYRKK